MRNQVLWKNPYAQPIITSEESDGERDWVTDCSTQTNLFKRKDFSQGSRLSEGHLVCLVRESNKEQWYTNDHSYFLRSLSYTSVNVSLEHYWRQSDWSTVVKVEWRASGLHVGGEEERPTGHPMWTGIGFVSTNDHSSQFPDFFVYATEQKNRQVSILSFASRSFFSIKSGLPLQVQTNRGELYSEGCTPESFTKKEIYKQ